MKKRLQSNGWTFPLALLLICFLSFGPLIPWLGFYQDDWYQIWFGRTFGAGVYPEFFSYERPFIGPLYSLITTIVGFAPLQWLIFGILTRWLVGLAFFWSMSQVWPENKNRLTWATILLVLYPGFRQQFIPVIYSHYFLQFAVQLFSLGLSFIAVRNPEKFWRFTIPAVLTGSAGLFISEYFFGLELLRPVLFWVIISQRTQEWRLRARLTILNWLPYLTITLVFFIWRIFIFQFPTYQPIFQDDQSLISILVQLSKTIIVDIWETGLRVWALPLRIFLELLNRAVFSIAAVAFVVAAMASIAFFLFKLIPAQDQKDHLGTKGSRFGASWLAVGLFSLLVSGWPFWFVGLDVDTQLAGGSRFTLSFMVGAAFIVVGMIDMFIPKNGWKVILVAVLSGFAVGSHIMDAGEYRKIHQTHTDFFQQLVWRAPALVPQTLVLTNVLDLELSGDNSLTAALNWIYDPQPPYSLDYMLFYLENRLRSGHIPALEPGHSFEKGFRTTVFSGNTSDALVIYYDRSQCLHVLDPAIHQIRPRPLGWPKEMIDAVAISNLNQIVTAEDAQVSLPEDVFKATVDQNQWCFYYQKADLARQEGNWGEIVKLGDEAAGKNLMRENAWELAPFIEAYTHMDRLEQAGQLTEAALKDRSNRKDTTLSLLCSTWERVEKDTAMGSSAWDFIQEQKQRMKCPQGSKTN